MDMDIYLPERQKRCRLAAESYLPSVKPKAKSLEDEPYVHRVNKFNGLCEEFFKLLIPPTYGWSTHHIRIFNDTLKSIKKAVGDGGFILSNKRDDVSIGFKYLHHIYAAYKHGLRDEAGRSLVADDIRPIVCAGIARLLFNITMKATWTEKYYKFKRKPASDSNVVDPFRQKEIERRGRERYPYPVFR